MLPLDYEIDRNMLVFITHDLYTDVWRFGRQPTTEDIAAQRSVGDTYVIQKVGELFEVYDLKTLKTFGRSMTYTIGVPAFSSTDQDAAIMWAMLNS